VSGRSHGWGAGASGALVAFYVTVLWASGGREHLADQARTDWWLLVPIIVAFGVQVALTVELRHRHRTHLAATTGAGTGASAVGMVACCAHHLVDLIPLLGAAGVAGFLFDWRIPLMAAGLAVNLVAVAVAVRRLGHLRQLPSGAVSCAA
jgi:CHASE2 domain-containing sensor protein